MENQHSLIERNELVKEIHYHFEGIDDTIIGRIFKITRGANFEFMWSIDHYCRTEGQMDYYIPSAPFGDTQEVAESLLELYTKRFEKAVAWVKADQY